MKLTSKVVGYGSDLLWEKWSQNPELTPGFEFENPWIQGRDTSQHAHTKALNIEAESKYIKTTVFSVSCNIFWTDWAEN